MQGFKLPLDQFSGIRSSASHAAPPEFLRFEKSSLGVQRWGLAALGTMCSADEALAQRAVDAGATKSVIWALGADCLSQVEPPGSCRVRPGRGQNWLRRHLEDQIPSYVILSYSFPTFLETHRLIVLGFYSSQPPQASSPMSTMALWHDALYRLPGGLTGARWRS